MRIGPSPPTGPQQSARLYVSQLDSPPEAWRGVGGGPVLAIPTGAAAGGAPLSGPGLPSAGTMGRLGSGAWVIWGSATDPARPGGDPPGAGGAGDCPRAQQAPTTVRTRA